VPHISLLRCGSGSDALSRAAKSDQLEAKS